MLELQGVSLGFGALQALADIELSIMPGERVALVGANGSGKSTLLRLLHGLLRAGQGRVVRREGLRCAMLFQRPHMLRASVLGNVSLALWLQGRPWSQARADALLALRQVGLAELAARNARTLSGGQQQRLALACAWARRPELLLLDEPTASLDPHAKRDVEALIAGWAAAPSGGASTTLVFASHNLGQVKRLAQRVIYLEQGRVLADLPVQSFFDTEFMRRGYHQAHLFLQGELI